MTEPGGDLHDWETRWADLQEVAADTPGEALPEVVSLVGEMLAERGYDLENPVVEENEDPDIVRSFLAAREIALADETAGVEQEDVQTALDDLTDVYDYLVEDRAEP
jgi:N-acetyl-anhydromuramyl-L-alanine amidase AmpD